MGWGLDMPNVEAAENDFRSVKQVTKVQRVVKNEISVQPSKKTKRKPFSSSSTSELEDLMCGFF